MRTTTATTTDRIEKQVVLNASRARVWRALTDTQEFNSWFGVQLAGAFARGERLRGPVMHRGYEHLTMEITIEEMQPERRLAWRWHPGADDGKSKTPDETTLVVFELEDVDGGTLLKVTETGFDRIPLSRRDRVYRENTDGWTGQMKAIAQHVGA